MSRGAHRPGGNTYCKVAALCGRTRLCVAGERLKPQRSPTRKKMVTCFPGYRAPRKGKISSACQTRSTKCSGAVIFSLSPFFFLLCSRAGYYLTLLYHDTRPLLPSPPPPYAAAAARRRRRRTPPPSSPLPHPPPPPLPQHATDVTPESFADVVRVCCTPRRLRCRPFAYRATVNSLVLRQQRGGGDGSSAMEGGGGGAASMVG